MPTLSGIEVMVSLEGNVDDTLASLSYAVKSVEPRVDDGTLSELDLSRCQYLGPLVAAYLCCVIRECEHRGKSLTVRLPTDPPRLRAFCSFSGLAHLVGQGEIPDSNHPQNETVPLSQTGSNWLATQPIVDLIVRHVGAISGDFEETMCLCIRELFQNIDDHANSAVGGWYSARYMRNKKHTRVAVADRGQGIYATLSRRYPEMRDPVDALKRVIEGGYTSKSTERNRGLGISNLVLQVKRLGGRAVIMSHGACAELIAGKWRFDRTGPTFGGTAFYFSLPVA